MPRKSVWIILLIILISTICALGFYIRPAKAIIWIEGHITSDTTWTPVDIYRVINNTYVDTGVTLTIEPGVRIEVGDGFSLIIEGSLNATGTETYPIVVTSTPRPSPSPGIWNTMKFAGNETEFFTLKHTTVEFGTCGVTVQSAGKTILEKNGIYNCSYSGIHILSEGTLSGTLSIRENTLKHNHIGISSARATIYTIEPQSDILIENNSICHNENYGIYLHSYTYGEGRIKNVAISNNTIWNNGGGVYIYSGSSYGSANHLNDVTVSNNTISNNSGNGIYLLSNGFGASLYDVTVFNNTVSTNKGKGIDVHLTSGYGGTNLHDVTVSNNTVSFNDGDGILLHSSDGPLYNVTVSNNTLLTNSEGGIRVAGERYGTQAFDLLIYNNVMSANKYGCNIAGGIRTHFLVNSISYNTYGVLYSQTNDNLAIYNDIYQNSYGMNVTSGATVNAEYNYWGSSTGPYHSLNPEGKGNPVNGDGTDLDFIPFLTSPVGTINERPVAVLEVDKTDPMFNETMTFDATSSIDDGRIDYYFFDFGDGTNSSWTTLPVVTHKYAEEGTYNTTLIVMDDFGVTSLDGNLVYVEITVVPEFPSILILPLFMLVTLLGVTVHKRKYFK